jgi:hypothetical protein
MMPLSTHCWRLPSLDWFGQPAGKVQTAGHTALTAHGSNALPVSSIGWGALTDMVQKMRPGVGMHVSGMSERMGSHTYMHTQPSLLHAWCEPAVSEGGIQASS